MKKVADHIADFLEEKEIKHAFGIIGSGNAQIFDAIVRKGYTEIICNHHEQACVIAAGTYFRVTGKPTVVLVTTGAGSTNAVTGVVDLWADSLPCLVISGNENSKYTQRSNKLRMWGIQGYDSVAMVRDVVKYGARVNSPEDALAILENAYFQSQDGRPGPTWVDIPMNIQATHISYENLLRPKQALSTVSTDLNSLNQSVSNLHKLISQSKRPLFWLGHGIRLANASHLILQLLEKTEIPALVSWAGIDMIDSDHPLVFGRAGVYGNRAANFILQNCDLLISVGNRMAIPQIGYDLTELARDAKIAVVDCDPAEIEKLESRVTLPICADASLFLKSFIEQTQAKTSVSSWLSQCNEYKRAFPPIGPEHNDSNEFINTYKLIDELHKYLKPDEHIVTDMGTALLCGHQALQIKKGQRLLTSTGLGEMGFGLPGAIGVSIARNRGEVMCLNCDGGMMMNLQELQTIVHHWLPIKIIIFNNDGYLMIKHTQKALFEGRYSCTNQKSGVSCPDFSKLAVAFGMPSFQIRTWNDFHKVMPELQNTSGPAICEIFMDPEQLFVPKLSLAPQKDGTYVSPPLEDLSPLLPRETLEKMMLIGVHPKSKALFIK